MELEQHLINFLGTYGLPVFVISCIIIFSIGILKYFNVFSKIKSTDVKKFIYYTLDIALSFGFVACYFAIFKIEFSGYLLYCLKTIPAVTTLYALYENFGVRRFLKAIGNFIVSKVAKSLVAQEKEKVAKNEAKADKPATK